MPGQNVIVIHGGSCWTSYTEYLNDLKQTDYEPGASPSHNWQQHLQKKLGSRFKVLLPEMPNWQNAKYLEWKIWFTKILRASGAGPMVVGHSLGSLFLIKYFSEERVSEVVKGLFLVSTPFKTMREDPGFGDFALRRMPAKAAGRGRHITFYHSKDDRIVVFEDMEKYQRNLPDARFRIFERRGHFLQKSFPELIDDLRRS